MSDNDTTKWQGKIDAERGETPSPEITEVLQRFGINAKSDGGRGH